MSARLSILDVLRWRWRARWMSRLPTSHDLVVRCGPPGQRYELGPAAVWQYPLQVFDGELHSIYVAIANDRPIGACHQSERFMPKPPPAPTAAPPASSEESSPAPTRAVARDAEPRPRDVDLETWLPDEAGAPGVAPGVAPGDAAHR